MAAFATSLHLQAEFEREHSLWKDQYQKFSRSESVQTLAWSLYGQGHSLLMLGQVDEAIRLIEASIAIPMKNADDKILDTSRYGALSLAYFRKGEYGKSLENILQHQRLSPSTPPLSSTVQEYGGMFEAVIGLLKKTETGGYSPSHTELARIKQTFRRIPHIARALRASPVNKASTYLYEGIYNEMSGNLRRARHSWRKCIELAETFQQPYEQGRAHYEMGLNVKNPAQAGHFEEAYRIFHKLHTPYELELVERALEQATSASGD
jgi:tetratricopeptide (TPR) repeat protein